MIAKGVTNSEACRLERVLIADRDMHPKQRHTARRVWQRLVAEHGAVVSEVTVSRYVTRRRFELDLVKVEVCIPQTHEPGAEAKVDFGEFYATIAGQSVKCWMFVMLLSHSGRAFHIAYGTPAQEAFLEGHVLAFQHFGGVPGRVRYDNLKPGGEHGCPVGVEAVGRSAPNLRRWRVFARARNSGIWVLKSPGQLNVRPGRNERSR